MPNAVPPSVPARYHITIRLEDTSGVQELTEHLHRNHRRETESLKDENLKSQGERLTAELKALELQGKIKQLERERSVLRDKCDAAQDRLKTLQEVMELAAQDLEQQGADQNQVLGRIRKLIKDGPQRHSEMEWQPEPPQVKRTTSDRAEDAVDGAMGSVRKRRRVE